MAATIRSSCPPTLLFTAAAPMTTQQSGHTAHGLRRAALPRASCVAYSLRQYAELRLTPSAGWREVLRLLPIEAGSGRSA